MADPDSRTGGTNEKGYKHVNIPQKRKSDVAFDSQDTESGKKLGKQDLKEESKPRDDEGLPLRQGKPMKKTFGISMNIGGAKKTGPIKMTMPSQDKKETTALLPKSGKVASVFNEDSESDEEEMPPEAKMRMRNVGRETPTAAGPNSFGKGNLGFCDRTKMIERDLKRQMEEYGEKADKGKPD